MTEVECTLVAHPMNTIDNGQNAARKQTVGPYMGAF